MIIRFYNIRLAALLLSALMLFPVLAKGETSEQKRVNHISPREVFAKLESPALELLSRSNRLDMLDYWDVDSVYKASNVMEGLSWIENLTDDYMKVRITGVSYLEIKILPSKKEEKIVATIYTIGSSDQAADSQIDFYDENLMKLDNSKYMKMPALKDFFEIPKGSLTSMKEIQEMIPFPTVAYSFSPDSDLLTATLTVEDYINPDDWNIVKLFIKPRISAPWHKEKFEFK